MSLNGKEVSTWSNDDVTNWLKEINLSNYIDSFQNSQITGYDLCYISNTELKEELRINRLHDRSTLLKSIREALLDQLKIIVRYEEKSCDVQLDIEKKTTAEILINLVREAFRIGNDKAVMLSSNSGEIISKNCNICDMILLNSNRFRSLNVLTELKKNYGYSNNSDLSSNMNDPLKKTNSSSLGNYSNKVEPTETKFKKYNEITGIGNNYNLPNDNYGSIKDYSSKYDFKYNKGNDNFSNLQQTSTKLNSSLENKSESKYEQGINEKYSTNSNYLGNKETKFMAITDDYKVDNSLEVDKNSMKKYDNLGTYNKYNFKAGLDKDRNYDNKADLQDGLNDKDLFYDKEFKSFNNSKPNNYSNYNNDDLLTPKDSNFNNALKYETSSQKHSPLRSNNGSNLTDKKYESRFDYLGGDKDKSAKDRYFSSEKRFFRNGEKEKEKVDKFESNNSITGANNNIMNNNNIEEKDYFKGFSNNPPKPSTNKPSFEENPSYKSSIPSDLKYKIDSMRSEFNENIKRFQDPKKTIETNIPMKQTSSSNVNLPTDKKLNRNNSNSEKKK